jgi:hypothetical protein
MNNISVITSEQLADALAVLGVKFLFVSEGKSNELHIQPKILIQALAESNEARLRLSLIKLFLEHPEFSIYVPPVAQNLNPTRHLTLMCYYSAAVYLQKILWTHRNKKYANKAALPEIFSRELDLPDEKDPEIVLRFLAERHRVLSGDKINWLGTYYHAVHNWLND